MSAEDYKRQGLLDNRYELRRNDGRQEDSQALTFVLRYDKNDAWGQACRDTLRDHAARIERLGYEQLAAELRERMEAVERQHAEAEHIPVVQL